MADELGLGLVNIVIVPFAPVSAHSGDGMGAHSPSAFSTSLRPHGGGRSRDALDMQSRRYGVHVLMHKVPLLWKVHRVHHLDTHLDVSTTLRSHPLEIAVKVLVLVPVSIAFGLTPIVVIAYQMVEGLVDAFSHANIELASLIRSLVAVVARHTEYAQHPPFVPSARNG